MTPTILMPLHNRNSLVFPGYRNANPDSNLLRVCKKTREFHSFPNTVELFRIVVELYQGY